MIQLIEDKRHKLSDLCRIYRVQRLDVFGSAATDAFSPEASDIDFVARFEGTRDRDYAERFYRFAEALESLLGHRVDLLTERMIRNPYFRKEVERSREVVVNLSDETHSSTAVA